MKLVIIVLAAYSILASAADYYKFTLLKKIKRELEELRAKHSILYNNIKDAHGLCEARRLSRPQDASEAQMFKLEPHSPVADDVKAKSIEVF